MSGVLATGEEALRRGDWNEARVQFEATLRSEPSAPAAAWMIGMDGGEEHPGPHAIQHRVPSAFKVAPSPLTARRATRRSWGRSAWAESWCRRSARARRS
jgi:hypothetical protein